MAQIKSIEIESGRTLERDGSYHKQGRTMIIEFSEGEWPISPPPDNGSWVPIVEAYGKQLDAQVNAGLGLAKGEEPKAEPPVREEPTEKQLKYCNQLKNKIHGGEGVVKEFLDQHNAKALDELTKKEISDLIDILNPKDSGGD